LRELLFSHGIIAKVKKIFEFFDAPRLRRRRIGFSEDDAGQVAEGANISPDSFRELFPTRYTPRSVIVGITAAEARSAEVLVPGSILA
jgi:hypothetical protein